MKLFGWEGIKLFRSKSLLRASPDKGKNSEYAKKNYLKEDTMMYQQLVKSFQTRPRDVHTVPILQDREPVWFYTYIYNGLVCVESGRFHDARSHISGRRVLNQDEYDTMLALYHRREKGEAVSQEASQATQNQVYWYGIFADMGL